MEEKIKKSKAVEKTKIEKIQEIYGKDANSSASLEEASKYLKKKGFPSLADLLIPSK